MGSVFLLLIGPFPILLPFCSLTVANFLLPLPLRSHNDNLPPPHRPHPPHYRQAEWNYQRGAAATVDRPFLGWMGRFFLHDVAHFHVVHHFFPKMPWYNGEAATAHLSTFIGEHYKWDDKPVFKALWDNYNQCQFVEDEGDVLFYRDRKGQAARRPADAYYVKKGSKDSNGVKTD
ncbi:hypothetical protein D9758_011973 [Tetrapyrgos nigripes]|uniref:Fatty acid desaturase domain-containing protein n=1 Tax=Tetrapyrgos nigripes TaxID=182062 RepID=A0A8H5D4U9_9AGAR|nr:hypothetical protein D9758_011973 [Tetrapyrgos nigripes]